MFAFPRESLLAKYLIKTHYIAKVLEFHPEDQTVDVMLVVPEYTNSPIGDTTVINEFGNTVTCVLCAPDILTGIPVVQLRWGQFSIQACPEPGDTGYIEVFTNDILSWVKEGEGSLPWSDEHFMKKSSVFVPFVANTENKTPDYPENNQSLVIKSANATITLTDDGTSSDVKIQANTMTVEAQDGISLTGNVAVDGTITATQNITSQGDIIADTGGGNGVTLLAHTHSVTTAPGTTGTPTPGPLTPEEA